MGIGKVSLRSARRACATLIILGLCLVAATVPGSVYGDLTQDQIQQYMQSLGIKDVPVDAWFSQSIVNMALNGLMEPDENGDFHPGDNVIVDDAVGAFSTMLGVDGTEVMADMKEIGLWDSDTAESSLLTRMDVARLIVFTLQLPVNYGMSLSQNHFLDAYKMNPNDQAIMQAVYAAGLMLGYEDGTFGPDGVLTRAELATLLTRILAK